MPQPLRVVHKTDPKVDIREDTQEYIDQIEPLAGGVLLVMYERGHASKDGGVVTRSGLFLSDKSLQEDKWQGKVGLVMKLGPLAFQEDGTRTWGGFIPKIGDWVMINVGDSYGFDLAGDRKARIVEDVNVKAIVQTMDIVW